MTMATKNTPLYSVFLRRLFRPLPVTVLVATYGAIQFHRLRRTDLPEAKPWEITCYRSVPLRILSRGWGWISNRELPVRVRPAVYSQYASLFGVNLQEAASEDLTTYHSLCEFFCRSLKEGARPIDKRDCLVSPADGKVLNIGKVISPKVEQVKGVTYSLEAFLGECSWNTKPYMNVAIHPLVTRLKETEYLNSLLENKENALYQCVIYLAPGDYHRFHSPVNWKVKFRRHIEGELLSVNPVVANWIPNLFSLNERAVYVGRWKHGFFSFTAIGATNVGSIRVVFDEALKTNERKWLKRRKCSEVFFSDQEEDGIDIKKGDLFGEFRMGSTIVLIFEAPKDFQFLIQPGERIKVGEAVSHCF